MLGILAGEFAEGSGEVFILPEKQYFFRNQNIPANASIRIRFLLPQWCTKEKPIDSEAEVPAAIHLQPEVYRAAGPGGRSHCFRVVHAWNRTSGEF